MWRATLTSVTLDFENLSGGYQNGIFTSYYRIYEDGFKLSAGNLASLTPDNAQAPSFGYNVPDSVTLFGANEYKTLTHENNRLFDATSIDLDHLRSNFEYGTGPVTFVGVREDGSLVEADFSVDRLHGMQTFAFGSGFTHLTELRIPGNLIVQYDNIVLEEVNRPPVAVDDHFTTNRNEELVFDPGALIQNDRDADGDKLSNTGMFNAVNGSLSIEMREGKPVYLFTPDRDFTGTARFEYQVRDTAGNNDIGTVTVDVLAVNRPPVAGDATVATPEDGTVTVTPLSFASDADAGDTLTVTAARVIEGAGEARIDTYGDLDNVLFFTPGAAHDGLAAGETASAKVAYTVQDSHGAQDTGVITFTIEGQNDAPTATADAYSASSGQTLTVAAAQGVLANDGDIDGDRLSAAVVRNPANGTLTLQDDGSFAYTPQSGFKGLDSFTYTARDAGGLASAATRVTLNVASGGDGTGPTITLPDGGSTYVGTVGAETVQGGSGSDSIDTGAGADAISGGGGADLLDGGSGADSIVGGAGTDSIEGGKGSDLLTGGTEADSFIFGQGDGRDVITDFSTAGGDVIQLPDNLPRGVDTFAELQPMIYNNGDTAVIPIAGSNGITLVGVSSTELQAGDFLFV